MNSTIQKLRSLQQQRVQASAELLFEMLENQHDLGVDAETLRSMHPGLARIVPVQQRTVIRRTSDGLGLLQVLRSYSSQEVQRMLHVLDYPEFMQDLRSLGYAETRSKFIQKCVQAALAHDICIQHTR